MQSCKLWLQQVSGNIPVEMFGMPYLELLTKSITQMSRAYIKIVNLSSKLQTSKQIFQRLYSEALLCSQ